MLLLIFLPFFNFLLILCFGRFLNKISLIYLICYLYLTLFISTLFYLYLIFSYNIIYFIYIGTWLNFALLEINYEFIIDSIALLILVIVTFVSFLVHLYSIAYIKKDPHFIRFISYLSLFTFFIFILVTASNLIILFVGWEGVGICSYLLINFWHTRLQASKAAIKAILINRIGDCGFLIAISTIFYLFKTFDFIVLYSVIPVFASSLPFFFEYKEYESAIFIINFICLCLFIGVIGKSAQLGLHTWLPAAIEGPTPVSALIHAATIVTAGVFLLVRTAFLFDNSPVIQLFITIIGALTAIIGALTAIFLFDIKRIIAYSTCSQLGYIIMACGLSQYNIGFFHLLNHAFFKALLFLAAGAIIHSFANEQDIRRLNYLFFKSPFLYISILIGNITIIGLPFLSGYYSKDLIIELTYLNIFNSYQIYSFNFNIIFYIIIFATVCTAIYSFRLFYFLFLRSGLNKINLQKTNQPFFIKIVLTILIISSCFFGYFTSNVFINSSTYFNFILDKNFDDLLYKKINLYFENEFLPWYIKILPLCFNILIIVLGSLYVLHLNIFNFKPYSALLILSNKKLSYFIYFVFKLYRFKFVIKTIQINFYFNEFYNYIIINNFIYCYSNIFLNIDKGILEFIGPTSINKFYKYITKFILIFYKINLPKHIFILYYLIFICLFVIDFFL